MNTLKLESFDTLSDAKLYEADLERSIPFDLLLRRMYNRGVADTLDASITNAGISFKLLLSKLEVFDFGNTSAFGIDNQLILDDLITEGTVNVGFKNNLVNYCNYKEFIYNDTTEHEFALAKGTMNYKSVTQVDGWLTIELSRDTEKHNPNVYRYSRNADKYRRVTSFRNVYNAGRKHTIEVPQVNNLYVDDHYGAII